MSKDKMIDLLNDVIQNAITHGGDAGGPYYSNGNNLKSSIENILEYLGIKDYELMKDEASIRFDCLWDNSNIIISKRSKN